VAQEGARPVATAVRLAAFYGAVFAVVGVQLPFWPVWLEAQGLSAGEIGLVIAASFWPRVVTSLLIPHHADRLGERRRPMVLLAAITLFGVALFAFADKFWMFMGLSLVTGATFAAILPLGEALALQEAHEHRLSYGRVRLWGSITFILAAIAAGRALQQSGPEVVLVLLVVTLGMTVATCLALPERPSPVRAGMPLGLGRLLRQPGLVSFVLAAGLIQASHVVYYGFATLHWRAAGHGEAVIGWLWAEGVVAEIVLFACAATILRRLPALQLLVLAGGLSILRWGATALSTDLAVLIPAQALHAASFGAAHLATVHHLRDHTPLELQASAQGFYAAIGGALLSGLLTPIGGWLYGRAGGEAFWAMAAIALIGTIAAIRLMRRTGTISVGDDL
jgi:MFS transporter, PPP family, 3-phenylpropionic acid transporter